MRERIDKEKDPDIKGELRKGAIVEIIEQSIDYQNADGPRMPLDDLAHQSGSPCYVFTYISMSNKL